MARTIDYLTLMVGVTPYDYEGHHYDALNIIVAFRRGRGFCITWQPVKIEPHGYITGPMPSRDPLVGGGGFVAKEATRNSVRTLETMRAALQLAKNGIAYLFDERDWEHLKGFMGSVANYGYTAASEQYIRDLKQEAWVKAGIAAARRESGNNSNPQNNETMKLNIATTATESNNVQSAQVNNPVNTAIAPEVHDAVAEEIVEEPAAVAEPEANTAQSIERSEASYTLTTYTTKKGGTASYIFGFASLEEAQALADRMANSIKAQWRFGDNGAKRYCLSLATRYTEVAQQLTDALNAGDKSAIEAACKASIAIYEGVKSESKGARPAETKPTTEAKTYTAADVAAILRKMMTGGALPEDVARALAA